MRIAPALLWVVCLAAPAAGGEGAIRAFARCGQTWWAAGDAGLILRSDDETATWRAVPCDTPADFTAIAFDRDGTGYLFGGQAIPGHPAGASTAVILRMPPPVRDAEGERPPADRQVGLRRVPTGSLPHLHGGRMEGSRGIVFGRPTPRHTSGAWMTVTGGKLWVPLKTKTRGAFLGGDFLGLANGCLVGPDHRIAFLHRLGELATGQPPVLSGAALTAVRYLAPDAAWAAGEDGSVLFYGGPGRGWRPMTLPLPKGARRLADLEAAAAGRNEPRRGELFLAGGLTGAVFHTRDGGRTFRRLPAPRPGGVHALALAPDGALLAGGDGGRIWRSGDGGKSWRLLRGREGVDALFLAGPGDLTVLPALVAHALAGAEVALVWAAMPHIGPPGAQRLRGDVPLRSASAAAGAAGGTVLTDFHSVAGDPARQRLNEGEILKLWSADLDVPARPEMLRMLVAAIRLYRPAVLARGPDGYEAVGTGAESRLISRLAAQAAELAADESAFPELLELGLSPWRVKRVFTGFEDNARFVPPWGRRGPALRRNLAAEFIGWRYPRGSETSLSMLALRGGWLLPWATPDDRPAEVTAYRCSQIAPRTPLFTSGLSPAQWRPQREPPVGEAIASGAALRGMVLMAHGVAAAVGPLTRAVKDHPRDPLPADMLRLVAAKLSADGNLTAAAEANRLLLAHGGAHPLFHRANVAAAAMAVSGEWRALSAPPPARPGQGPRPLKAVLRRLLDDPWRVWVSDEWGAMLIGKGHAAAGDFETARAAYGQLLHFTHDPQWRSFAEVELAALADPASALAKADALVPPGLLAHAAGGAMAVDGKLEEGFWSRAQAVKLDPRGGGRVGAAAVTARFASTGGGLAAAIRIAPGGGAAPPDKKTPPTWRLEVALDADRDTWTQLLLRCDSTGRRSLRLLTRLGTEARLKSALVPVQARAEAGGWVIELSVPHATMGTSPARVELLRLQVRLALVPAGGDPVVLCLAAQGDDRLLPHRYALLALPPAGRSGAQ